jgi:DNA polymerase
VARVHRVHLDFEAFSEVSIKKVGTCRYAEHPSTEVLCAAYALDDGKPRVWVPGDPHPRELFEWIEDGALVHAWNVEMEIPTWREICVRRMGWPRIPFSRWRDTAALSLVHAMPAKLEDAGRAMGLAIQKDSRGKHLINKLCKPRRPSKTNPATRWTPKTAPKDFEDLYEYCARDVEAERAVGDALPIHDLDPLELAVWRLTTRANFRGWAIDSGSVDAMLGVLDRHSSERLAELSDLTQGVVTTSRQVDKGRRWLRAAGLDLPNLQADTVKEALKERDLPRRARAFLHIRRELALSSVAKYQSMAERVCDDGTVKNNLLHHGAATGRDAGRGIQIQNFPRKSVVKNQDGVERAVAILRREDPARAARIICGSVPRYASEMLRSMLIARPGKELFAADFAQIENRVTVWYADCPYGIDVFRRGLDEYRMFGSQFYYGDDLHYDDVDDTQRDHSKRAVLGFCFGMAEKTYVALAKTFGVDVSLAEGKRVKDFYRGLYKEVVQLWHGLNRAAMTAVQDKTRTRFKRIGFEVRGDFLFMRLASDRELAYYRPRVMLVPTPWGEDRPAVTHMGFSKKRQWTRLKMTPGRWTENAVQATARDVLMECSLEAEDAGYEQVGRVHDELVAERDVGTGDLEEFVGFMRNPKWLKGIPIVAEGWVGRRYRK